MNTFSLPKTQHLVVFQEVIRSGSIGAGAKALGLTQPAVSKIIGDMESYFGSELIVRRNTGVSLTEAGQVFLNWSEAITREMKNMVNEMNALTNSAVVDVSFGFPSLVGFTFMSEMVHQFKMTFPKARVSMSLCWWRTGRGSATAPSAWPRSSTSSGCCRRPIWATTANC